MKRAYALILFLLIAGCTPMIDGYSKPTLLTIVPSYLDEFPLDRVTKESLIHNLGVPDKTKELDGKVYYAYDLGYGHGNKEYVYELTNGVVTDVRYHDQGSYNGSSARKRQGK